MKKTYNIILSFLMLLIGVSLFILFNNNKVKTIEPSQKIVYTNENEAITKLKNANLNYWGISSFDNQIYYLTIEYR